jgi:glycopeptide antibiotics resistance protein
MRTRSVRILLWILLVISFAVLTKYILFKKSPGYYRNYFAHEFHFRKTAREGFKNANFKLLHSINLIANANRLSPEYKMDNIGGNIFGFVPLGILLPLLFFRMRNFFRITAMIFFISLCFETTQLFTGLGVFDVDDLLLNTIGGMLGYLAVIFFTKKSSIRGDRTRLA